MTKKARTVCAAAERARRDAMIGDAVRSGHCVARIAKDLVAVGFAPLSRRRLLQIMKDARARPSGAAPLSADFRATELKRLDELQEALHAKALGGDNAAVDRVLAILDRRSKLLGVSPPPAPPEAGDAKEILQQKLDAMAGRLARARSPGGESR
jgi:hypothetical protein